MQKFVYKLKLNRMLKVWFRSIDTGIREYALHIEYVRLKINIKNQCLEN